MDELSAQVMAYALGLPEAWEDHPWGDTAIKVRKKVFLFVGRGEAGGLSMSMKLPSSALVALERPWASPTRYGLGKSGWVSMRLSTPGDVGADQILAWVRESYCAVAPKTLARKLDAP